MIIALAAPSGSPGFVIAAQRLVSQPMCLGKDVTSVSMTIELLRVGSGGCPAEAPRDAHPVRLGARKTL